MATSDNKVLEFFKDSKDIEEIVRLTTAKTIVRSIRFNEELWKAFSDFCQKSDISTGDMLHTLVLAYLKSCDVLLKSE